jgi:RHS repeat-associated protein
VIDAAGNATALSYDAFGLEIGNATTNVNHRYTGEYFDQESGLYHLRARDYDPVIGRFISMDEHPGKQTIPLTLNKYLYTNADPINYVDPSGNFISLSGTMNTISSLANLTRLAFVNGGRQAGGAAFRTLGKFVERRVGQIIQQCLKPGVKVTKQKLTGDGKVTVDFFYELGKKSKAVEVKYQLGLASSEGFKRAARQMESALKVADEVVLVTFKDIVKGRKKSLLDKIGNPGPAAQIGAMVELSAMMGEFVIEGCIH